MNMDQKKKRDLLLIAAVCVVAGAIALGMRLFNKPEPELIAYIQVGGDEILRFPLSENAKYLVADGQVLAVEEDVTLESLGEEAEASKHDINLFLVKDGTVCCAESNCENQICVHTPAITGDRYDTPIVCLPHDLFLYLVTE